MRCVDADRFGPMWQHADEGASLRAMTVQNVRIESAGDRMKMAKRQDIGRPGLPMNRDAMNTEGQARSDLCECRISPFAAGQAVCKDSHMMAKIGLAVREVDNMSEDAADRGTDGMQNSKRLVWRRGQAKLASLRGGVVISPAVSGRADLTAGW